MKLSETDNGRSLFEPTPYLYQAVVGAFRAQGKTFASWCDANQIKSENGRAVLHGVWKGPKASAVMDKILDGADRETVQFLVRKRLEGITTWLNGSPQQKLHK